MNVLHKHIIRGQVVLGRDILRCPKCRRDKGLTLYGYLGKKPRVTCPCGADFMAPPPFDQPWLLEQLAPQGTSAATRLSVGRVPDPGRFT
ncbi:hypothetical protein [Streptomyces sp. SAJ15]|uniref:hypothetical protein n=1 Tax=Streptomyces sp. SAJ15 TaxID=2011095 RepID=UPI00118701DE|nr:hypothetical protein [Streptomyces sp. SAJ15]TVL89776.1 hypothetical protein CD790_25605 [Streptomyces sp. SAJ15]